MARVTHFISFLVLASTAAHAQTPADGPAEEATSERPPAARNEVVLGVTGPFDPEARTTLVRLLRAELAPHGLSLVETDPTGEARDWARSVSSGERRLLAVLLDTKGVGGWRLVVIDSARGRAISRELPRGERDAANVEAIVSIVVSATNALREGLEVASAPLESVVDPGRPRPSPPPRVRQATPPRKPEPSGGTSLHAGATALTGSFADGAEPTFGGALAVGVSIASFVDVDLGLARHFPVAVETPFGGFELERTSLALSAGPVFRNDSFAFVPSLGAVSEWIHRSETRATSGVGVDDEARTIPRIGGALELRGRYRLLSNGDRELLSLVGTAGASYFGKRVRFLAGDEVLSEARKTTFQAGLGLFIATGPL